MVLFKNVYTSLYDYKQVYWKWMNFGIFSQQENEYQNQQSDIKAGDDVCISISTVWDFCKTKMLPKNWIAKLNVPLCQYMECGLCV